MKREIQDLTKNVIHSLQVMLEQQRKEILSNGKTLRVNFNVDKDELLDEADTASHDVEQGMQMRLGNRESLYFKKIEEALLRIKEGVYGLCIDCGSQISAKRLEARPTAELCIDCKETAETQETKNAEGRRHKSLGELINFKA
ncbi:MAG TPA: TraR/DksA C4-type zinc finger protein [Bdellovibrionota bacterium]|jgi:DnaK suppressor protein